MRHSLNISILGDNLQAALKATAPAITKSDRFPIMHAAHLSAHGGYLTVTTMNLNGITVRATVRAQVHEEGTALVMHKLLSDTIAPMEMAWKSPNDQPVRISQPRTRAAKDATKHKLDITCGPTKSTLWPMPLEDYPTPKTKLVGQHYAQTLPADVLCKALAAALGATANTEANIALQCVTLQGNALLTGDRYRLAEVPLPIRPYKGHVLWHGYNVAALCKAIKATCGGKAALADAEVEVCIGDSPMTAFYVHPYETPQKPTPIVSLAVYITNEPHEPPDFAQAHKKTPYATTVEANKADLLEILAPVWAFAKHADMGATRMAVNGRIDLSCAISYATKPGERGKADITSHIEAENIVKTGPDNQTAFDCKRMIDAIKDIPAKRIRIGFDSPTSVIGIWDAAIPATEKPAALLMPLQLND